jgi:inner membrane protein
LTYYEILLAVCLFLAPINIDVINWRIVFIMLFLGALSHLILDLYTPSGLAVFWPLSDEVYHKKLAIIVVAVWLFLAVSYVYAFGHILLTYQPFLNYII